MDIETKKKIDHYINLLAILGIIGAIILTITYIIPSYDFLILAVIFILIGYIGSLIRNIEDYTDFKTKLLLWRR